MKKKIFLLLCASLLVTGVSAKKKHVNQPEEPILEYSSFEITEDEVPL